MNEAARWVDRESESRGRTRLLLKYMAECAEGCIVVMGIDRLARLAKISRRQIFRSLREAQRLGEIQQVQGVTLRNVRPYHLEKCCANFFASGSDTRPNACPQLAAFLASYGGCAKLSYIRGRQLALLVEPSQEWVPVITDEELRWRSEELRRRLGTHVPPAMPFSLRP